MRASPISQINLQIESYFCLPIDVNNSNNPVIQLNRNPEMNTFFAGLRNHFESVAQKLSRRDSAEGVTRGAPTADHRDITL